MVDYWDSEEFSLDNVLERLETKKEDRLENYKKSISQYIDIVRETQERRIEILGQFLSKYVTRNGDKVNVKEFNRVFLEYAKKVHGTIIEPFRVKSLMYTVFEQGKDSRFWYPSNSEYWYKGIGWKRRVGPGSPGTPQTMVSPNEIQLK